MLAGPRSTRGRLRQQQHESLRSVYNTGSGEHGGEWRRRTGDACKSAHCSPLWGGKWCTKVCDGSTLPAAKLIRFGLLRGL